MNKNTEKTLNLMAVFIQQLFMNIFRIYLIFIFILLKWDEKFKVIYWDFVDLINMTLDTEEIPESIFAALLKEYWLRQLNPFDLF